ncbi:hypothetical protein D021_1620B, partial [Vibrio parahaemolyticus 10296]
YQQELVLRHPFCHLHSLRQLRHQNPQEQSHHKVSLKRSPQRFRNFHPNR